MRILSYGELSFSKAELNRLGSETTALLSAMAYALNEINTFQRLFVASKRPETNDESMRAMFAIEKHTLARALNAKVFEALKQFSDYRRKLVRKNADATLKLFDECMTELTSLKCEDGYKVSNFIRNKFSNHYVPSEVEANLAYVSERANQSMFHHEMVGNSFYPLGEDYVFVAGVNRWAEENGVDSPMVIDDWMDWSVRASGAVSNSFQKLLIKIVQEHFPEKALRETKPYLDSEYCVSLGNAFLPLVVLK